MAGKALRPLKRWLRTHGGPLGSVVAVQTTRPEFVLTYDDGPEPGGTDAILPVLERHGATATFFVLMNRVHAHPSLLREVISAGHEIALHGPDHQPISRMSRTEVRNRTAAAKADLESITGTAVRWFRPPYGLQTIRTFRAIRSCGLEPVLWGPSAVDSREATDEERLARALRGAAAGVLLLSHDGYAGYADGGRSNSRPNVDRARLADTILTEYANRGLRARSLSHALRGSGLVRGIWFKR